MNVLKENLRSLMGLIVLIGIQTRESHLNASDDSVSQMEIPVIAHRIEKSNYQDGPRISGKIYAAPPKKEYALRDHKLVGGKSKNRVWYLQVLVGSELRIGERISFALQNHPNSKYSGTVYRYEPIIGSNHAEIYWATFAAPLRESLDGMEVAGIAVQFEKKSALSVPNNALRYKKVESVSEVFVIHGNNEVEIRVVEVLHAGTDSSEIGSQVSEGDLVVLNPTQEIQDKSKVKVVKLE